MARKWKVPAEKKVSTPREKGVSMATFMDNGKQKKLRYCRLLIVEAESVPGFKRTNVSKK